ncbi:hypothetical protein [Undibacterium pigrum]|uniref:Uncharacterized protein n=1 Tax=Undibacterium pigrum TaxID=401470 RepID=A0A318J1X9_9BURK|nr:hypothetical protein [Undibacterium pigrum]PXX40287.1 hypothetical protein DFR42_108121 [Undibacterium pigrum]
MSRDIDFETTPYVLEYFQHLMTDEEREAVNSFTFNVVASEKTELMIFTPGRNEPSESTKKLYSIGSANFRDQIKERLLLEHRAEIYANACPTPKYGKLPKTPKAKQCLSCSHSWRETIS